MTSLDKSIKHWAINLEHAYNKEFNKIKLGNHYCKLCKEFNKDYCTNCPICIATKINYCISTPYSSVINALNKIDLNNYNDEVYNNIITRIEDEYMFLLSLKYGLPWEGRFNYYEKI